MVKNYEKNMNFSKGDCKTKRTRQFMVINEILYKWYGKCCATGIYPFGSMLQEEALKIKESLSDSSLDSLLPPMGGWKNGNRAMEFEKRVLPRKPMMSLFLL